MRTLLFGSLLALLASCGASGTGTEENGAATPEVLATPVSLELGERAVQCGCTLEAVGHCGEYAEVGGEFVALQLPEGHTLGKMPFCGKSGLTAKIGGTFDGETLVASSFELSE